MIIKGKALVMGDNVNTDVLHPSSFFSLDNQRVRAGFLQSAEGYEQVGRSDLSNHIVIAGNNFGCGSSRETGARVFLLAGIRAIVARSLARIFSRNLRNLGLAAVECPSLADLPAAGSAVEINLETWSLDIGHPNQALPLMPLDPYWRAVLLAGGLMPFIQKQRRAIPREMHDAMRKS
jgi:3-isopropylmalate/(R)-2-methylmalate dehydratase small subunit